MTNLLDVTDDMNDKIKLSIIIYILKRTQDFSLFSVIESFYNIKIFSIQKTNLQ